VSGIETGSLFAKGGPINHLKTLKNKKGENQEMNINNNANGKANGRPAMVLPGTTAHERNEHYHRKAMDNIHSRAEKIGVTDIADTEDDMKELLAYTLGIDDDRAEILYEMWERAISCHHKKIYPEN
jgi:hypothetical protein